ncbi:LysR family transcriptional regulator, partial [Klebsiella pneumoniae]|nr:LysR family transcriptional regulator [Klebsiella pneumoniae]
IDRTMNSAVQSVRAFSQDVTASLTMRTRATACLHLLPPLLQHLRQHHPLLTLGVASGNTLGIVLAVEENRLGLGLVPLPMPGR